jgi:splicing factor 4
MDESAYQDFKIAQDNVGFKLLQKMGWTDGQGLGSTGQGITAPIDK